MFESQKISDIYFKFKIDLLIQSKTKQKAKQNKKPKTKSKQTNKPKPCWVYIKEDQAWRQTAEIM